MALRFLCVYCDILFQVNGHMLTREQQKKLSALEMELAEARKEGFISKYSIGDEGNHKKKKKLLAVIGITTQFGQKRNRDAIQKA